MTATVHVWPSCNDGRGRPHWVRIVVHDTVEDLRAAAARHSGIPDWSGVNGAFHPVPLRDVYDEERWRPTQGNRLAGTIRLVRGFDLEVLAHECAHAALTIHRMRTREDHDGLPHADLGPHCSPVEEHFAWLLGSLVQTARDALAAEGLWVDTPAIPTDPPRPGRTRAI